MRGRGDVYIYIVVVGQATSVFVNYYYSVSHIMPSY